MSRQAISQQRAKHALEKIQGYTGESAEKQKKYNSYVASLGPMILMSGFGQACAFYLANNNEEHQDVLNSVAEWLKKEGRPFQGQTGNIIQCISNCDSSTYRMAQIEALAYLDWLKKLAKAFLKSEEEGDTR